MPFTLRITFTGLCLFVPEPVRDRNTGRMHVLMPAMHGHHHHGAADRHVAAVAYDAGALLEGGAPIGVTALAKLGKRKITLVGGDEASLALCGHIVDLRGVTGRGVDPDHLGADSKFKLHARVTLGAGRITRVSPGVCWEWGPGEFRPIAHVVEWEAELPGDRLALMSEPLRGGGMEEVLGTLFPSNGELSLQVYHSTALDLPPDPAPIDDQPPLSLGESPKHFSAFYGLFGGPVPNRLPRFWAANLDDCPPVANPCTEIGPDQGGTPFTCVVAGVSPEPEPGDNPGGTSGTGGTGGTGG